MKNESLVLLGIVAVAGIGLYIYVQKQKAKPVAQNPNQANPNQGNWVGDISNGLNVLDALSSQATSVYDNLVN